MRKVLKILGVIVGVLVGIVLIALAAAFVISEGRLNRTYTIADDQLVITVPTDEQSIKEGERIANLRGCTSCHTSNLGGQLMADIPPVVRLVSANLTRGKGSAVAGYTDADFVRAIRHGVNKAGQPLWIMPSDQFNAMSDADLGHVIAYIKSVPAVDNELPKKELRLLGRALLVAGQIPLMPAETINHDAKPWLSAPAPAVSVEYGQYLSGSCMGCHGPALAGNLGGGPGEDPSPNLTPAGDLKNWSEVDFIKTIRSGVRPDGVKIDGQKMPLDMFAKFSDDELKAIYLYIKSLPAKPTGSN